MKKYESSPLPNTLFNHLKEWELPDGIQKYVKRIWTFDTKGTYDRIYRGDYQAILPHNTASVVIYRCNRSIILDGREMPRISYVGPGQRAMQIQIAGDVSALVVEFKPMADFVLMPDKVRTDFEEHPVVKLTEPIFLRLREQISDYYSIENALPIVLSDLKESIDHIQEQESREVELYRAIFEELKQNYYQSTAYFTEKFNISYWKLNRDFNKYTGMTYKSQCGIVRCRRALELIREGKNDYTHIAYLAGYYDLPHLITDLKKRDIDFYDKLKYPESILQMDFVSVRSECKHKGCP